MNHYIWWNLIIFEQISAVDVYYNIDKIIFKDLDKTVIVGSKVIDSITV